MTNSYKLSGQSEVALSVPVVLVALLEDVPHDVLFLVVLLLDQPHVQLDLTEEGLPLAFLPLLTLTLGLTRWPLAQDKLGAVEVETGGHLVLGDAADVPSFGTDLGDVLVDVVGAAGDHFLEDLH